MPSDAAALPRTSAARANAWLGRVLAEGLVMLAIFGGWLTARSFPAGVFPTPLGVARAIMGMAIDPSFWWNAGATALRVALAIAIATPVGTAIGLLPRYLPSLGGIVEDLLIPFFGAFPSIVWAILGTVWFGVTPTAVLLVQTLIIIPFCLVNVTEGAKNIPAEEVEMGRSFGRSRLALFWRIELPYLSPFILAGVRIAYGVCWKLSLIAELFGARSGLGFLLQEAQDLSDVDSIVAICLVIVLFVIVGEWLILRPLARMFDTGGTAAPLGLRAIYARAATRLVAGR
jgi:NitT/TauT family transport system permease protein